MRFRTLTHFPTTSAAHSSRHTRPSRKGFTLVEVLMVIAIIGILVGLLVPAVVIARRTIQQRAIAFEVESLSNAVEQYKQKYNDYPPDGSSTAVFERHLRKVFPNIAASELTLFSNPAVAAPLGSMNAMDPAEALVFFLGGFSDDPIYPISGAGGPIYLTNSSAPTVQLNSSQSWNLVQYNVDRNNPLFEFKQSQLSLDQSSGATISGEGDSDVLPAYVYSGKTSPYVYFDSRTYTIGSVVNGYAKGGVITNDAITPYLSSEIKTTGTDPGPRFLNDRGFQVASAGLDDQYGGRFATVYQFPSGSSFAFNSSGILTAGHFDTSGSAFSAVQFNRYQSIDGVPSSQLDNAANFSDGILEDSLDN